MSMHTTNMETARPGSPRGGWHEHAVPPAMLIVAVAMGVAGHLHMGLQPEFAAAVGLAMFCLMLVCHVLLRAADDADRAAEATAERHYDQIPSPIPASVIPPAPQIPHGTAHAAASVADHVAAPLVREPLPRELQAGPLPSAPAPGPSRAEQPAPPTGWRFRPVDIHLPTVVDVVPPAVADTLNGLGTMRPAKADDAPQPAAGHDMASTQAERIDAILKRLAGQIRSGMPEHSPAPQAMENSPEAHAEPTVAITSLRPQAGPADALPDAALASAVDALRSTVAAMRAGPSPAGIEASAVPAAPSQAEVRLAAVAEALALERANVFLEPILALREDQARHFEVSVRLVSEAGEDLEARSIAMAAGGAGLLAVLDAVGLRHAAGFALKLERRGRDGTVFSAVAGRSLADDQFVTDATGRHAQGIADRLVLTFAQDEMRGLGPAQISALGDLGRLGFRFALTGVADLDMDFEALQLLGFHFVKLDAAVFLRGLTCAGEGIPATDICRYFDDLGLEVIVSGIDDANLRQRVEGCGVTFGQGLLFGEPRPIPVGASAGSMAA